VTSRVRPLALLAAAAAAAVGLSGCNTSPGAAALVGSDRISTVSLQHAVDRALADPQADSQIVSDRVGFTRTELGRLINNRIVAAAAAAHNVTASPTDVDQAISQFAQQSGGLKQLYQQAAQSGIPKSDLRTVLLYYVLEQKLADALVANQPVTQAQLQAAYTQNIDQFDQVHSAHILVKTKGQADSILKTVLKDPSKFAKLAAAFSSDTSNKAKGGDLGFAGRGQFVPAFSNAIFAAKPGSFIEVHSQFGWHVVHVIQHKQTTFAQATPQLKTDILKNVRTQLLSQALQTESKKLGIHVNPRYGNWDPSKGTVVAAAGKTDVSSPSPSPTG
jgi:parvulin-like peptidyl-prolyl isomerase